MSTVTVVADDNGMVIRQSKNNPEYGVILLEQTSISIQQNPSNPKSLNWIKKNKLTTLLKGTVEELKELNYKAGQKIEGKIVVKESVTPFSEENPDQHLKIAGKTGVVCCLYGQPIYRITYYTSDMEDQNELINHDNVDAIRSANSSQVNNIINTFVDSSITESELIDDNAFEL